jgi:MoxR-like ATPase
MVMDQKAQGIIGSLRSHISRGEAVLVERKGLLELIFLGLIAQEHVLLIGPPGVGKSAAARQAAKNVGGSYFEYLIGRFTEPAEIFGPLDINALRDGQLRPDVSGMLPEADIAFLDEIFLGSTAILNTLLGLLNERQYRRGHFHAQVPLRCCIAASNRLPDDSALQAFADRFLLTHFIEPVSDHALDALLEAGIKAETAPLAAPSMSIADIDYLAELARSVSLETVRPLYTHIVRKLRNRGVNLSDRRLVKGQKCIAAAALVAGRMEAGPQDLWPIIFLIQDKAVQQDIRDLLQEELKASTNDVFANAVKEASLGAHAHIQDLQRYGLKLLEDKPKLQAGMSWEAWLVRAEALLTQIDAGFRKDALPENLRSLRAGLAAICQAEETHPGKEAAE